VLIDLVTQPVLRTLDVDICIIGAGPAGISIAAEYIGTRHSVALLEAGFPEPDEATQMLNLAWAKGPIIRQHPFYLVTSRLRLFGGSQNGWGGWCTPLLSLDLEDRDWVEHSGWPISMSQLVPYYERAARICGLHESAAHPVPECPAIGGELTERRYYFTPPKRTVGETFLKPLADAENISVYLGANVTTLDCDRSMKRVSTVRARTLGGAELSVTAKVIVLAAGGVENARLLLANDLGNDSDLVGRFFMEHPHVLLGSVELPKRSMWERYVGRMSPELGHLSMWALALSAARQQECRLLNATVQLWPAGDAGNSSKEKEAGDDSQDEDVFRARLVLRAEQSPNPESRVTLGDYPDALGVPVARLDWELQPRDWESICDTAELVRLALVRHADARVALSISRESPWPSLPSNSDHYNAWGCHHIGTTRMSSDPGMGVVDPDTRVHGMENLFIAGSSIFPTAGYANPTFTLIALALRTADHVKRLV
jgi:choline dehydrogenase-like flavoprotein